MAHRIQRLLEETLSRRVRVEVEPGFDNLHRQQVGRAKTRVDGEQPSETSHQQPGANQQDERERNLGDDQRPPSTATA
jgi:hypothetical protein